MAVELQQDVDEIESDLNQILPAVEAGAAQIHDVQQTLAKQLAEVKQHTTELRQLLESFQQAQTAKRAAAEQYIADVASASGTVIAATQQGLQRLQDAGGVVQQAQDLMQSAVEAMAVEFRQTAAVLTEGAEELIGVVEGTASVWSSTAKETVTQIGQWTEGLQSCQTQFDEGLQSAGELLNQKSEALAGEIAKIFQTAHDEFVTGVETQLLEGTQDGLSAVGENIEGFAQDATSAIDSLAEDVKARLGELLEGLRQYAEDEIKSNLKAAFDELVDEVLAAFIAELIESVVLTQAGVATTSALSPVIPALVVAEKLLSAVKNLL